MAQIPDFSIDNVNMSVQNIIIQPSLFFKNNKDLMNFTMNSIDLTTLEGSDTSETIVNLCKKAENYISLGLPNVAAICVYPVFVRLAKAVLIDSDVKIACVAGAFPSGQSPLHVKLSEINYALDEGADEVDMVISRGKFLQGDYNEVFDEISTIKEACKAVHLKVILETGELGNYQNIYNASMIALKAGADFIKTSTGKITPAATPEASYVMLYAIKDYYETTGRRVGFKAAGGISTPEQAYVYIKLVESILDQQWLNQGLFRIGASRLTNILAEALTKDNKVS